MSRKSKDGNYEKKNSPTFETNYAECPMCERRIHKILFDSHAACRNCRGLNSDGSVAEKYTKEKPSDVQNS